MLWAVFVILLLLWVFSLLSGYALGGFIHLLPVIAAVILILQLGGLRGERANAGIPWAAGAF